MPGAVEATREGRPGRADRDEARTAPHVIAVRGRAGCAEAAAQRVTGGLAHRHQLQLVRGIDGVRPFRRQHGARAGARAIDGTVAADDHPVVARRAGRGGEIETCEITTLQHLRAGQALGNGGCTIAYMANGSCRRIQRAVEVGIDNGTTIVIANNSAVINAGRRELARIICIGEGNTNVVAHHAAHGGVARHIAGGIAVAYRTGGHANQAAEIIRPGHIAGGIAVRYRAAFYPPQQATQAGSSRDIARRIAVRDRAFARVNGRQAAAIATARAANADGARGIAVADRAAVVDGKAASEIIGGCGSHGAGTVLDEAARRILAHQAACRAKTTGNDRACRAAVADRARIGAHQRAHVDIARTMHGAAAINVIDLAIINGGQRTDAGVATTGIGSYRPCNADVAQAHVAHRPARADIAEHTDGHFRTVDRQPDDFMAQAIERAREWCRIIADRHKSLATLPAARGARVDIAAQHIVAGQIALQALHVVAGSAVEGVQTVNDLIHGHAAIAAQLGTEIIARWQIHFRLDVVGGQIAGGDPTLAVFQRQAGRARAAHGLVDVDIVLRRQGQLVGRPIDVIVDVDIALRTASTRYALDLHIARFQ